MAEQDVLIIQRKELSAMDEELNQNLPVRYEDYEEYLERKYGDEDIYKRPKQATFNNTDHEKDKIAEQEYEYDRKFYKLWSEWRKRKKSEELIDRILNKQKDKK